MIKYESDKWKIFLKSERHDISEYYEAGKKVHQENKSLRGQIQHNF